MAIQTFSTPRIDLARAESMTAASSCTAVASLPEVTSPGDPMTTETSSATMATTQIISKTVKPPARKRFPGFNPLETGVCVFIR